MRADGTEWVIPEMPAMDGSDGSYERFSAFWRVVGPQLRRGAIVTYPDGTRYKASWKPERYYMCEGSGAVWRVMRLRKIEDE